MLLLVMIGCAGTVEGVIEDERGRVIIESEGGVNDRCYRAIQ